MWTKKSVWGINIFLLFVVPLKENAVLRAWITLVEAPSGAIAEEEAQLEAPLPQRRVSAIACTEYKGVSSTAIHHFFTQAEGEVKPSRQAGAVSSVIFPHFLPEKPHTATLRAGDTPTQQGKLRDCALSEGVCGDLPANRATG